MTIEITKYSDMVRSDQEFWSEVFCVSQEKIHDKGHLPRTLQVARHHVLTAKLNVTVEFYRTMETRAFSPLPGVMGGMGTLLDAFCLLATFDNLAKARYGDLKGPSFWIRGGQGRKAVPVLQLDIAAKMAGMAVSSLRACLLPLVKDGAVEFVRAPGGVVGVRVVDGYINDTRFKSYSEI